MTNLSNPHSYTIQDLRRDLDKIETAISDLNNTLNYLSSQINNQEVEVGAADLDDWLKNEILLELQQIRSKLS